jgi:hypothetical protein
MKVGDKLYCHITCFSNIMKDLPLLFKGNIYIIQNIKKSYWTNDKLIKLKHHKNNKIPNIDIRLNFYENLIKLHCKDEKEMRKEKLLKIKK